MTSNSSQADFTRRKFTITKTLDETLIEMADQNYQGNVSLCLRAAIEDHRTSLAGTSEEIVAHQLTMRLDKLAERQERLAASIEGIEASAEQSQNRTHSNELSSSLVTDEMQLVHDELLTSGTSLRVDDLAERLQLSTSRIQPTLSRLIDLGHVVQSEETAGRYRLAGDLTESLTRENDV